MKLPAPLHTVRGKLILWNVSVLALVLLALGGVLRLTVERNLTGSIDRDMAT